MPHLREAEGPLHGSGPYRVLFETNPLPMWVFDDDTLAFLAVNEAACRHYGYSRQEFLGMTIRDIRPSENVAPLLQQLASQPQNLVSAGVRRHRKKDGTVIDVEITSHPLVFDWRKAQLILVVDVTERRHLEEQLRESQKLEAIGRLAGGIAHDFNNLLTAILGYADILRGEIAGGPGSESLEEIQTAGERAATLTRQLLIFSRKQVLELKVLDANSLVTGLEKMLRRLISEDIEFVTVLDPSLGRFKADAGQLEQVIVNLSVNARDAMPRGGTLTIETSNVDLDETYAREHTFVLPGPYVLIAVSDTGVGMSAEIKSHVFEPFFTTKAPGKGTGLGLATVFGVVKQSNGHVWVYSEPGHGTSFKIYFPRVDAAADTRPHSSAKHPGGGTETILLVEDDQSVRTLSRRILESRGYTVLGAADADQALNLARSHEGPIHLILSDVVMPTMGGRDLASRVVAIRPEIKVLYMSGYTDDAIVRNGLLAGEVSFLQKPFTPNALAAKLREVLEA